MQKEIKASLRLFEDVGIWRPSRNNQHAPAKRISSVSVTFPMEKRARKNSEFLPALMLATAQSGGQGEATNLQY